MAEQREGPSCSRRASKTHPVLDGGSFCRAAEEGGRGTLWRQEKPCLDPGPIVPAGLRFVL